ncbi:Uncharacterised protein [Legionella sainthelensi]|nr:Uncharacterised protein [Legionella sainthelensi]
MMEPHDLAMRHRSLWGRYVSATAQWITAVEAIYLFNLGIRILSILGCFS